MTSREQLITIEEFHRFIEHRPDRRFELIHGEIVEKMPTQFHAFIVGILTELLRVYVRTNPVGYVLVEARYAIPGDEENDRIIDLSYVKKVEGRTLMREGAAPYMPDLAIEVQSPGQGPKLMSSKAEYYLKNGSTMVWLIYPDKALVEVITHTDRLLLSGEDKLTGGELLPRFEVPVKELFEE